MWHFVYRLAGEGNTYRQDRAMLAQHGQAPIIIAAAIAEAMAFGIEREQWHEQDGWL